MVARVATLCLVPTPLRAGRAARRLCDAEGGLLFGPVVATPESLVPGLLAAAGDRRALLPPLAERLLALEAGREAGGPFAGLAPAGGLARALAGALSELRRGEVGAEAAEAAARKLGGRPGERLAALAAALLGFERRLRDLGALDAAAGARAAAEAVRRGAASQETRELGLLVLEGFQAPSPAAFELLAALAGRARRTLVRVPYFPERADACAPAEDFLRRLEALHEASFRADIELTFARLDAGGERAPLLAHVLGAVAGGPASGAAPQGGRVLSRPGAGEEGESDSAARIAAGLLEDGFAPGDVVFLAPAPARTAPFLAHACSARGVPFAGGHGLPLGEAPPVAAIRAALGAAGHVGRAEAEALARSTYLGLARVPDRLGLWLDRAGTLDGRRDPEEALRARAAALTAPAAAGERARTWRAADAVRDVKEALGPLAAPGTARAHAARLGAFVSGAGVRRRAARSEPEVARRDLAAVARLEELADELARALALLGRAEERLSVDEWLGFLDLALASASCPVPPEPAAGAAELWPLDEAPGLSARAAVLVGCGRGAWPAPFRSDPLLREPERAAVNAALRRTQLATAAARRARSIYLGFSAMAAAREVLAFTWPGEGPSRAGDALAPFAAEALAAAGAAEGELDGDPQLAGARTTGEALRAAARLAREGRSGEVAASLAGVGGGLAGRAASAADRGAVESERREAVRARRATPHAGLVPRRLAAALSRALPDEWSPTQLETDATCPFRLFLGEVARLPEREGADLDIDPRDEGGLLHAVLERFVTARRARGAWPPDGGDADRAEAREVARLLFDRFEAEGRVGDPSVWPSRRDALLARLDRAVLAEARLQDGLRPELLEHRFGGSSGRPPLVFEDAGEAVRMKGRIDRVDASADRLLVVDYKNARGGREWGLRLSEEALGVTSFQVPAYLIAAARELPGRQRLAATYALLRSADRAKPLEARADDPFFAVDEARRAEVRASGGRTFADAVVAAVRRIRGGEFPIASRDCAGCGFGAVCRFPGAAEGEP
jgi:hypothetical protein